MQLRVHAYEEAQSVERFPVPAEFQHAMSKIETGADVIGRTDESPLKLFGRPIECTDLLEQGTIVHWLEIKQELIN